MRIVRFTEVFETTAKFFPQYIYIGSIDEFGNSIFLRDLYNLSLDNQDIEKYLTDLQTTMSWEIYVQMNKQVQEQKITRKKLLYLKKIEVKHLHERFNEAIYDEDIGYIEDIKSGKLKYIDDYSEEWENSWKKMN